MACIRAVCGNFHRQVAILAPLELDVAVERFLEARTRRVGGALPGLLEVIEGYKREARVQVVGHVPFAQDLAGHTPGRDANSVALAMMCGLGARINDLGPAAPLPRQVRALARLVAEVCLEVGSPVERFLTRSEAADNLDLPEGGAPHAAHGFRTTREVWDLEAWVEGAELSLHPPMLAPGPGWMRLADWVRCEAVRSLARLTRARVGAVALTPRRGPGPGSWTLPGRGFFAWAVNVRTTASLVVSRPEGPPRRRASIREQRCPRGSWHRLTGSRS